MSFETLRENLLRVEEDIAAVRDRVGGQNEVRIVGVTKGHGPDAVRAAHAAGLSAVGENRVQEAVRKRELVGDVPIDWHLIGHLQTNKAKFVPHHFAMVHSIDSPKVADALDRALQQREPDRVLRVLIQVNIADEGEKSGCHADDVERIAGHIASLPRLELRGLMTMAPFTTDEVVQRKTFRALRALGERLAEAGVPQPDLSMGMSNDYRAAVAEGATILRLGTALFGQRVA